ncbi:MAG: IS3 family transposase [Clostridia bacterium]|nr:IS3 family transposase [Clostridia bacterium]
MHKEIHAICAENKGRYGYRRVTMELRKRRFIVNHKVVMRLMKEEHLTCRVRMKKYHSYRGEVGKIAPNIINRGSPLMDMYNGEILSYVISDRPEIVTENLNRK